MSDKNTSVSDASDEQPEADVDDQETNSQDAGGDDDEGKVSRSTYKKTVQAEKKAREKARKYAEELEALKSKLLEAEGNKDEKIKTLSQQLSEAKKAQKNLLGATIKKALNQQVKSEASKAGSIDSDVIMSLIDLSDVEVDSETLEADSELIAGKIAELKKAKPFLFSKAGPNLNTRMPGGKPNKDGNPDLTKMKTEDLWAALRGMGKDE